MGKSLRGKECGKGICQRKDGLYSARFVSSEGKRQVKCFSSLPEARNWLEDAKYADRHEDVFAPPDMTVTEWFEFWISHIVGDLAPNTKRNYRERYEYNVKPVIGKMRLTDVKPMHCKMVFNPNGSIDYVGSTIRQDIYCYGNDVSGLLMMNDMIARSIRWTACGLPSPSALWMTSNVLQRDEQQKFLEAAKRSHNYNTVRPDS